jgi:EAL domain-containing protein (putative c-di-GMP-specific phosphodiesterase class I)
VIETIISFAKKMHYPVVAEYVHSKKILEILKRYEVDFVQGFYLGKPKNGLDI